MNKILITTSSFGEAQGLLQREKFELALNPFGRKLSEQELLELVEKHNPIGIIAGLELISAKVFQKAHNLRVISRCGVGVDSIDLQAAQKHAVLIQTTSNAPTSSVAELTVGLLLSVLRGILQSDRSIRQGEWERSRGSLLAGKTVGIVGCGRIGSYAAKLLAGFDCKLLGYDPYIKAHDFCKMTSLQELLTLSHVVTLHMSATADNQYFLGEKELKQMRLGSILINTARGSLIDEIALIRALREEHLAGAGIDVFEREPYVGELTQLPNVVLSAHMGSYTEEGRKEMEHEAAANLIHALKAEGVVT